MLRHEQFVPIAPDLLYTLPILQRHCGFWPAGNE